MIEAYMNATLDVLRLAGQMFLQRIDYELRRFAEDLHDFIYDLDRNPRRDWRERFDAFLADQTARGREITPESRRELIIYLEMWERNFYGGPPQVAASKRAIQLPIEDVRAQERQHGLLDTEGSATSLLRLHPDIEPEHVGRAQEKWRQHAGGPRGDQTLYAREAEDLVSILAGVPPVTSCSGQRFRSPKPMSQVSFIEMRSGN